MNKEELKDYLKNHLKIKIYRNPTGFGRGTDGACVQLLLDDEVISSYSYRS